MSILRHTSTFFKANSARARLWRQIVLWVSLGLWAPSLSAITVPGVKYHEFPVGDLVSRQVWFWEGIFDRYSDRQIIIHDVDFPDIVVDMLDIEAFEARSNRKYSPKQAAKLADRYIERYQKAFKSFKTHGREATKLGAIERRLHNVYARSLVDYKRLMAGKVSLRSQSGLADQFERAAKVAQNYLPYMEAAFRKVGLPKDLTRLAFVESMFNVKAVSKVGAKGMWQFMPATARRFMTVNSRIDERLSPFKSSEAAAKYLKANYRKLKSWPLAITSYNHGAGGMSRAVRAVGSKRMDAIIRNYNSNSFGFASKNFYAEFIAARNTYNKKYLNQVRHENPLSISRIQVPKGVTVSHLLNHAKIPKAILKRLNPDLLKRTYKRYRYRSLPKGYQLIVPSEFESQTQRVISRIKKRKAKVRS
jgi:membrane-bound lytic murein transglycosylase D